MTFSKWCGLYFSGHMFWVLFSSTEVRHKVKYTFDQRWIVGWSQQDKLKMILAVKGFTWSGFKGSEHMITEPEGNPGVVWCGQNAWAGISPFRSQSGHMDITVHTKAHWEECVCVFQWVTARGI